MGTTVTKRIKRQMSMYFPESEYMWIRNRAEENNRSMSGEVLDLIKKQKERDAEDALKK